MKCIETRSRRPRPDLVGQRIAIYATVSIAPGGKRALAEQIAMPYFVDALRDETLPRGVIVGTAVLQRATQMTEATIATLAHANPAEHAFGYYSPGRWAWMMSDPVAFDKPVMTRPPPAVRGPFEWDADATTLPRPRSAYAGQLSLLEQG